MKTPERFKNAINKLYNAYHSGELISGQCHACAVGNMCDGSPQWANVFMTHLGGQTKNPLKYSGEVKKIIDSTGYSWQQLALIENTFENNVGKHVYGESVQYNLEDPERVAIILKEQQRGLRAVVDVLCKIDNIPNYMEVANLFTPHIKQKPEDVGL